MADENTKRGGETIEPAGDPVEKVAAAIRGIPATSGRAVQPASRTEVRAEPGNSMLEALVYGDNDLIGLVAYAMHEVNRRDWCTAYEQANSKPPSDTELRAYLVGERLERRLDTYRRLAEDAIAKIANPDQNMRRLFEAGGDAGRSAAALPPPVAPATVPAPAPVVPRAAPMPTSLSRNFEVTTEDQANVPPPRRRNWGGFIFYMLLLLVAVVAVAWLIRYGIAVPGVTR